MNVRRSSGEIVNATLLETFLALVFLIFGLALFESQRADDAELAKATAPSRAELDSVKAVVGKLSRAESQHLDSLRRVTTENDRLRGVLLSKYPADCEVDESPAEWLTVTLLGRDRLKVVVHRTQLGYTAGSTFETSLGEFPGHFAEARRASDAKRCRYLVRIEDTPGTSKQDFKHSVAVVNTIFRPRNYLH